MKDKIKGALDKYILINHGNLRKEVCKLLVNQPHTATEISKILKKHQSSVSRILITLSKQGLVKCINKDDDRFRYYALTCSTKKSLKKIKFGDL